MFDREPSPIGDFVWAHMTEAERETVRRFMVAANGGDQDDEGFTELGNFGINFARGLLRDQPVEDHHIRVQLEWMAEARLLDETMDGIDWDFLMLLAAGRDKEGATRLASLFVLATGISDKDAFDERLRAERRAREATRG